MVRNRLTRIDKELSELIDLRAKNLNISKVVASRDLGLIIKRYMPEVMNKEVIDNIKKERKKNDFFPF